MQKIIPTAVIAIVVGIAGVVAFTPARQEGVAQVVPFGDNCTRVIQVDGSSDIHCPPPPTVEPTITPTVTPSPTVTASPTATPSPSPTTTAPPTTTPAPTTNPPTTTPVPSPTPTTTPPGTITFPGAFTTGVGPFWVAKTTYTSDLVVSTAGAIVEDAAFLNGADLLIRAPNVIVRRSVFQGGSIDNDQVAGSCHGTVIEDVSMLRNPAVLTTQNDGQAIGTGGYTARRVKIDGPTEGFRIGDKANCGPVVIEDSYANIGIPQAGCPGVAWHGDALQGYQGAALTVRHSTFVMDGTTATCDGTRPFFYPSQGNTSVDLDGVLAIGGYWDAFTLGEPGVAHNIYLTPAPNGRGGALDVKCSLYNPASSGKWSAWRVSAVAGVGGYAVTKLAVQLCNTEGGI